MGTPRDRGHRTSPISGIHCSLLSNKAAILPEMSYKAAEEGAAQVVRHPAQCYV